MKKIRSTLKNLKGIFLPVLFFLAFTAASVQAAPDLNRQIDTLAKKLSSSSTGDVLDASEAEVYISLGQNQGILPGNRFEIVRPGDPLRVGDEIVGYKETRIAEVEVSRARKKMSICTIVEKTELPKTGDKAYQLRKQINSLVVGQFSYNQSFNRLTKSLQEKLFTVMSNRGMQVVERDQLERVLKEQKLGYSGLVNMSSAKKIGKLLGAEGMLLGTVGDMGNSITINARLVDMENGNTITAAEVELPKTPLIAQLLEIPLEDTPFTTQINSAPKSRKTFGKKNQPFFENDLFRINVVSFKREGGSIELKLKYINRTKKVIRMYLSQPEENTYIVDKLGNQYPFKSDELGRGRDFPVGIPRVSTITFRDMNRNSKEFIATANYNMHRHERFFAHFKGLNLE